MHKINVLQTLNCTKIRCFFFKAMKAKEKWKEKQRSQHNSVNNTKLKMADKIPGIFNRGVEMII